MAATQKKKLPLLQPSERKIFAHIHGWFGSGKTWLAASSPGPVFFADVEGGVFDTPNPKVLWKDVKDDLSVIKGEKDLLVIYNLNKESELISIIDMLLAGKYDDKPHPFATFVLDSLSMFQIKLKREVQKPGHEFDPDTKFDWDGWNRLLNHMLMRVEDLLIARNPEHPNPVNVIITSGTDRDQAYARPLLEGGFRKRLPGLVDLHGFMRKEHVEGKLERVLYFEPTELIDAKQRLHGMSVAWPEGRVVAPTIPMILEAVNK